MIDTSQEIRIGDLIQTRKPHPCGASEWTVTRTGADIKMRCSGCGRIVMLTREEFSDLFRLTTKNVLSPEKTEGAINCIVHLDEVEDVAVLPAFFY